MIVASTAFVALETTLIKIETYLYRPTVPAGYSAQLVGTAQQR